MRNISDIIEGYLKAIIEEEQKGAIEIKRSEVAEKFQCVPSANQLRDQDSLHGRTWICGRIKAWGRRIYPDLPRADEFA